MYLPISKNYTPFKVAVSIKLNTWSHIYYYFWLQIHHYIVISTVLHATEFPATNKYTNTSSTHLSRDIKKFERCPSHGRPLLRVTMMGCVLAKMAYLRGVAFRIRTSNTCDWCTYANGKDISSSSSLMQPSIHQVDGSPHVICKSPKTKGVLLESKRMDT